MIALTLSFMTAGALIATLAINERSSVRSDRLIVAAAGAIIGLPVAAATSFFVV